MPGYEALVEHHRMLADGIRTDAFRRAIHAAVRPGDVVCDLGCGTGILSLFACEAGARHVYAIERTTVAEVARAVVAANGLAERVTVLRREVRAVRLPEPADVLVSEWLGHGGLEENMLPAVLDARRRLLRPGGRLVPETLEVVAAPVESPAAYGYVGFFGTDVYGFDLRAVAEEAASQPGLADLDAAALLAAPALQASIAVATASDAGFAARSQFCIERAGRLHGLGVWFESRLAPGVELSTAPGAPRTHWRHVFLPLGPAPAAVTPGDLVRVDLAARPAGRTIAWSWAADVCDGRGVERARFGHPRHPPA